ncbi:MAG TPA: hypothetical protein VF068_00245, partial [Rubrobacter sp.]
MAAAGPKRLERNPRQLFLRALWYALLILLTVVFVAPLLWMVSTSFKTRPAAIHFPLTWVPRQFSTE